MPKKALSASVIQKLPYAPQGKQEVYFDTRVAGFGVRVSANSKTYFVQTRVRGRVNSSGRPLEIKESLGKVQIQNSKVDVKGFEAALEQAQQIIKDAERGITPDDRQREAREQRQQEERARKVEEEKDITLETLFTRYIAMKTAKGKLKASTAAQYKMSMETHFADWLQRPAREITAGMVEDRHIEIGKGKTAQKYTTKKGNERRGQRGGKGAADLAMRVLRAVLSYGVAVYDDVFLKNPVGILSKTDGWYKLDRRESYIATDQLKAWFEGLDKLDSPASRTVLILGLFTGARKNEILRLKWSDLDLETGIGTFRETKNGKTLVVPIAQYAVAALKEYQAQSYSGPDGYVFPSHGQTGHLRDPRKSLEKVTQESGVNFMLHDFRRSFLTFCNAIQIPAWTQKRLVNHAKPDDVTQGYVQHEIEFLRRDVESVAKFILDHAELVVSPLSTVAAPTAKVVRLEQRRKSKAA
ncbi:tyrosine-type recombinase/integrase [Geomonas ferrireducens]|uniref:tyrosine-type recombinase/integrase n=1 Tax=Geomonas ferrireducens TaxID=2570227 RepID=UPI0010A8B0A7|nr:tyrosine-type recombinase/integrase [Geomonas ferrireducens]